MAVLRTAIADAFARAGYGSGKMMREVAEELLERHRTVEAARPHFHARVNKARDWMRDLELFYLHMVKADLNGVPVSPVAPVASAGVHATSPRGHSTTGVRAPLSTVPHRKRKPNPPRLTRATIEAGDKRTASIYDALQVNIGTDRRWIGNVRLNEAGGLADQADHMSGFWRKVENFAKSHANPETLLKNAMPEDMLRALLIESRVVSRVDIERAIARRRNGSAAAI